MINIYSNSFRQNPYPFYDEVRKAGSAVYDSKRKVWYVGRYSDVSKIFQNADVFTNKLSGIEPTLSGADGTLHAHSRKIVLKAFNKPRMNELNTEVSKLSEDLVNRMLNKNQCEFIRDIASHMPASVLMWMMGFDDINVEDVKRWSDAIIGKNARAMIAENHGETASWMSNVINRFKGRSYLNIANDIAECKKYLSEHFDMARSRGCNGWVTDYLVNQDEMESLSTRELLDIGFLMVVAGAETTTDLIGNAVLLLASNQDIQSKLRTNPELLESFIEEVLRYDAPVQLRPRYTASEAKIGNVSIPQRSMIIVLIGSANRDPEMFTDAGQFIIDRNPNKHLTFGLGRHFCLGAQLARIEAFALLDAMIRKLPPLRLANPEEQVEYPDNITLRGPRQLQIKYN